MTHPRRTRTVSAPALGVALAMALSVTHARAQEPPICRLHQLLPIEGLLRRTSLALRGSPPEIEEYAMVEGTQDLTDRTIDAYLASDAYRLQMRRYHEQLLWPNPEGATLQDLGNLLVVDSGSGLYSLLDPTRRGQYRGGNGLHACQDLPQQMLGYAADGLPICEPKGQDPVNVGGQTVMIDWCQEGYVLVRPYWDPASEIKVCAFDAQERETWQPSATQTVHCDYITVNAASLEGCGCGPDLAYCSRFEEQQTLWRDMREQLLRLVDDHSRGERPYSELLTTKSIHMNGRLAHFKKYLAQQASFGGGTYNAQHGGDALLPSAPTWTDEAWVKLERSGIHSGILTLPAYTLRFQTNRGRANRFRIAFLDQYFVPPAQYDNPGCDPDAKDLTRRCVCESCHQVLEPMAAYFGQIAERGSGLLSDFHAYCPDLDACLNQLPEGTSTGLFDRFYFTDYSTLPETYRLYALELAPDHPEYEDAYDQGPSALVARALGSIEGKSYSLFARATVKNLFRFLVKRDMNLDPSAPDHELAVLDELATELAATDDLTLVVRRIVRLEAFRRLP